MAIRGNDFYFYNAIFKFLACGGLKIYQFSKMLACSGDSSSYFR